MLRHMRTTIRLDDALLERAKRVAARRGITLTALVEQGLRLAMTNPVPSSRATHKVSLPVCRNSGGTLPGVDLEDAASLLDRMEQ